MERRSFLRGLLVSATAATSTAVIKLATPEETRELIEHAPVALAQDPLAARMPEMGNLGAPVYMVNGAGKMEIIGVLNTFSVSVNADSPLLHWDGKINADVVRLDGIVRVGFNGRMVYDEYARSRG